jgi:hypothetical protein
MLEGMAEFREVANLAWEKMQGIQVFQFDLGQFKRIYN